jgi:hypothetical protein
VAPTPEYSCNFCCTASEDFGVNVAGAEVAAGEEDLLQATRLKRVRIRRIATVFISS